jgi:hypothetical protein
MILPLSQLPLLDCSWPQHTLRPLTNLKATLIVNNWLKYALFWISLLIRKVPSVWDCRSSRRWMWRWLSSRMLYYVVLRIFTDSSEERIASIIRTDHLLWDVAPCGLVDAVVSMYHTTRCNIPEHSDLSSVSSQSYRHTKLSFFHQLSHTQTMGIG